MNKKIQRLLLLLGLLGYILPCIASKSPPKEKRKVSNNSNILFLTSFIHKRLFKKVKTKKWYQRGSTGRTRYDIRWKSPFVETHPTFMRELYKHIDWSSFNPKDPEDIFKLRQKIADFCMPLFDDDGKDRVLSPYELTINDEKLAIFFELAEVDPNGSRTINEVVDKLIAGPHRPVYNKKMSTGDYMVLIPIFLPSFMAGWWAKGSRVPKNTPVTQEAAEREKQAGGLPPPPPEEEDKSSSQATQDNASESPKTNYKDPAKSNHLAPSNALDDAAVDNYWDKKK